MTNDVFQKCRQIACVLVIGWMVAFHLASSVRSQPSLPVRLTAFAVNMSNVGRPGGSRIDIRIDRWSTDAERQGLLTTFFEKGPEKLLDALQDAKPVGVINTPGKLGWDLRYARYQTQPEGGSRIVILTDRPVSFWEARNQPRTIDYPFTLIELRLKPDGTGEGKASVATKITYNTQTQTVELENYANEPVRLNDVKIEGR
jgi:hypothetical protein